MGAPPGPSPESSGALSEELLSVFGARSAASGTSRALGAGAAATTAQTQQQQQK